MLVPLSVSWMVSIVSSPKEVSAILFKLFNPDFAVFLKLDRALAVLPKSPSLTAFSKRSAFFSARSAEEMVLLTLDIEALVSFKASAVLLTSRAEPVRALTPDTALSNVFAVFLTSCAVFF